MIRSLRWEVANRDVGCVALRIDPGAGPCYDTWGKPLPLAPKMLAITDGEMDFVRFGAKGKRHQRIDDHVWLCPGHHRGTGPSGGAVWATSHRAAERDYLDAL